MSSLNTKDHVEDEDNLKTGEADQYGMGDLDDFSRRWDNTSDQLKREWELPESWIGRTWNSFTDDEQEQIIRLWAGWESTPEEVYENKANEDHFVKLAELQEEEQAEGEQEHVDAVQDIIEDVEEETVPKEEADEVEQGDRVDLGNGQFGVVANQLPSGDWYVTSGGNVYQLPEDQLKVIAKEEGMASVSGPPAGTEPTVKSEDTFVSPNGKHIDDVQGEGNLKRSLADKTRRMLPKKGVNEADVYGKEEVCPKCRTHTDGGKIFMDYDDKGYKFDCQVCGWEGRKLAYEHEIASEGQCHCGSSTRDCEHCDTTSHDYEWEDNNDLCPNCNKESSPWYGESVKESDPIMMNENYIQLDDVLYRPRYITENVYDDDLVFENKFYTTEGVGNCQFCKGAGKVTVERLGLKECPDCDGTGDVQEAPNPEEISPMQPEITGEPVEKPNPFAKEEGTSDGAKKGWLTRKRGGKSDEPENKRELNFDEPYIVYKDFGQPDSSFSNYKDAVRYSDSMNGSVSDNSDEGHILYKSKGWDGNEESEGPKEIPPRKNLPSFKGKGNIHSMGRTDSGGIGEIPKGKHYNDEERFVGFKKIQEREKNTYEMNTNENTKTYEYQFEADDIDYFTDEELYSAVGAGSRYDFLNAIGVKYSGMNDKWNDLTEEDHIKISDAFRGNPVSQTTPNYMGKIQTTITFKSYPDDYVTTSNLSPDDAGMGTRISDHEVRLHNSLLTRVIDNKIDQSNESKKKVGESCKPCRKMMSTEASINKFKRFIDLELGVLKKRAKAGESVGIMYGLPTVTRSGRKIKGTLAYAGVSLNDRIYLPEELAKGHGKTLPLLLNHSSIAGAEDELDRLDDEMLDHLYNEKDYQVGEVTLTWDPAKLTLFYEGVVENKFFQKEIDDMDMAVSLGIYYDSDSPRVCNDNCYTLIKGAEFREVSLVYHAGFPIATIEAVEARLKARSMKSIEKETDKLVKIEDEGKKIEILDEWSGEAEAEESSDYFKTDVGYVCKTCNSEFGTKDNVKNHIETSHSKASEEEDPLRHGGSVDVEEKEEGPAPTIDLNDEWEGQTIITEMHTPYNFSVRGVSGMTISNANGIERYTFDPTQNYSTNTIHFQTFGEGASIFGETLQPKMGTPDDITKIIEAQPDIVVKNADESKKNQKVMKQEQVLVQ